MKRRWWVLIGVGVFLAAMPVGATIAAWPRLESAIAARGLWVGFTELLVPAAVGVAGVAVAVGSVGAAVVAALIAHGAREDERRREAVAQLRRDDEAEERYEQLMDESVEKVVAALVKYAADVAERRQTGQFFAMNGGNFGPRPDKPTAMAPMLVAGMHSRGDDREIFNVASALFRDVGKAKSVGLGDSIGLICASLTQWRAGDASRATAVRVLEDEREKIAAALAAEQAAAAGTSAPTGSAPT